jgi:two-component system, NarL family, sensor histidine kinase DesK
MTMKFTLCDKDVGWSPLVWLFFLSFFFFHPGYNHVSSQFWVLTLVAAAVFLALFFGIFFVNRKYALAMVTGMLVLGVVCAPFNPGANTFFIYAASFYPFLTERSRTAFWLLAGVLALIAAESLLLHLSSTFWLIGFIVTIPVGMANIYFAQKNRDDAKLRMAQEEIEHLAKVAERERIARDLHDVLGHTLSVIILKSELAGKLIEKDPARAKAEIGDVEKTSREALAEVRGTIRGYRARSLEEELKYAKATLETAGISVQAEASPARLTPVQESVVTMVMREAVTNVVRHAEARRCVLRLAPMNGTYHFEIQDDGRGGSQAEGNGLRGMRERIEALGGTLERETKSGTRLVIEFPLAASKESGA